ncbi:MAG: hypothetical protein K8R54_06705 [Bacteroidales bacterium]|nr:hypothetical protein [Bacteroidales bacterium]
MNIIFVTMGGILRVYNDVYKSLQNKISIGNVGFFVCDREFYNKYEDNIKNKDIEILKEWEITENALNQEINTAEIQRIENEYYKDESVWSALFNDRRVFQGKYCKVTQQYKPIYKYEQMLKIFLYGTLAAEKFIEKVKPDVVIGFAPSTFEEYIIYKVAEAKNINYLFQRSAKIHNYVLFTPEITEKYLHVKNTFDEFVKNGISNPAYEKIANNYISNFKEKGKIPYEGITKYNINFGNFFFKYPFKFSKLILLDILQIRKKRDNHNQFRHSVNFLYDNPLRDIRALIFKRKFAKRIKFAEELKTKDYIFFPLHSEPEIAITLFSKYYQNQIEVIRNIALQLPVKYSLIVKEHPRNKGRRTWGYYNNILNIPNVDFADSEISTVELTKHAALTVVLSGATGFEALLNKKPIIVLGNVSFRMLPKSMVNYLDNIKNLYSEIIRSISNFKYNEDIIKSYMAAMVTHSVPVDFYTVMLRKGGREGGSEYSSEKYQQNINNLSDYLIERFKFFNIIST